MNVRQNERYIWVDQQHDNDNELRRQVTQCSQKVRKETKRRRLRIGKSKWVPHWKCCQHVVVLLPRRSHSIVLLAFSLFGIFKRSVWFCSFLLSGTNRPWWFPKPMFTYGREKTAIPAVCFWLLSSRSNVPVGGLQNSPKFFHCHALIPLLYEGCWLLYEAKGIRTRNKLGASWTGECYTSSLPVMSDSHQRGKVAEYMRNSEQQTNGIAKEERSAEGKKEGKW